MLDFEKIKKGIDLDDGKIIVDEIRIINNTIIKNYYLLYIQEEIELLEEFLNSLTMKF